MSKKEKKISKPDENLDELEYIEQFWIKNQLPHLIESLPYDKLTLTERNIIDKIREEKTLTSEELDIIKKTSATYQVALKKYDAEEIIEAHEGFNELIRDEQELLDLVDAQSKPQQLVMNCRFNVDGKQVTRKVQFTVHPVTDSRAVEITQAHMDIYRDLNDKERSTLLKQQKGEKLTQAELDVIEHINQKIENENLTTRLEQINKLLASQVTPPSSGSLEDRVRFWEKFHFNDKMSLFLRVQDLLGLTEASDDELFLVE